eukprot:Nk52_evm11s296 gene=Nk52_evmTU11s296
METESHNVVEHILQKLHNSVNKKILEFSSSVAQDHLTWLSEIPGEMRKTLEGVQGGGEGQEQQPLQHVCLPKTPSMKRKRITPNVNSSSGNSNVSNSNPKSEDEENENVEEQNRRVSSRIAKINNYSDGANNNNTIVKKKKTLLSTTQKIAKTKALIGKEHRYPASNVSSSSAGESVPTQPGNTLKKKKKKVKLGRTSDTSVSQVSEFSEYSEGESDASMSKDVFESATKQDETEKRWLIATENEGIKAGEVNASNDCSGKDIQEEQNIDDPESTEKASQEKPETLGEPEKENHNVLDGSKVAEQTVEMDQIVEAKEIVEDEHIVEVVHTVQDEQNVQDEQQAGVIEQKDNSAPPRKRSSARLSAKRSLENQSASKSLNNKNTPAKGVQEQRSSEKKRKVSAEKEAKKPIGNLATSTKTFIATKAQLHPPQEVKKPQLKVLKMAAAARRAEEKKKEQKKMLQAALAESRRKREQVKIDAAKKIRLKVEASLKAKAEEELKLAKAKKREEEAERENEAKKLKLQKLEETKKRLEEEKSKSVGGALRKQELDEKSKCLMQKLREREKHALLLGVKMSEKTDSTPPENDRQMPSHIPVLNTTKTSSQQQPPLHETKTPTSSSPPSHQAQPLPTAVVSEIDSYEVTPEKPRRRSHHGSSENYDISDIRSDESTDDDEAPKKRIPQWAQSGALKAAIRAQVHVDPDAIFPKVESPSLEKMFPNKKAPRYIKRTSSAHWALSFDSPNNGNGVSLKKKPGF